MGQSDDPVRIKREKWESAFKEMAECRDDELVLPDVFENEEMVDWTWEKED